MSSRHLSITPEITAYLQRVAFREHPALAALRERNAKLPEASLQIGPEQGALLALLVGLIGAGRILEIGTFTGYSSTAMALSLPDGGTITCLDVSREWTDLARRTWEEAGVADRVDLRIGPAHESLATLQDDTYDLAFIDADKERYDAYYEGCLRVVRPGGLIAIDNTLRHGRVADPTATDAGDVAVRELNAKIAADERVDMVLLPIADGLTLARLRRPDGE
jgi:predicted O-methyltransferase YrrM